MSSAGPSNKKESPPRSEFTQHLQFPFDFKLLLQAPVSYSQVWLISTFLHFQTGQKYKNHHTSMINKL